MVSGGLTVIAIAFSFVCGVYIYIYNHIRIHSFTSRILRFLNAQDALDRGMVLVMSLWDDAEANMNWLDSDYPAGKSPSKPGVNRGPCASDSGKPAFLRSKFPDARVTYSEIKVG